MRRGYEWNLWHSIETQIKFAFLSGTGETVKNFKYLQKIGVTHVLNTAESDVNINPERFRSAGICYKGFR